MAEEYKTPLHRIEEATAVGNNVAWICGCNRLKIGSTLIAVDVLCECSRRYRVHSVDGPGARVARVEQVGN